MATDVPIPGKPGMIVIARRRDAESLTLSWHAPPMDSLSVIADTLLAAVLLLFLGCGASLVVEDLQLRAVNGWDWLSGCSFVILCFTTLLCLLVPLLMVRPEKPERVVLGADVVRYDPGRLA